MGVFCEIIGDKRGEPEEEFTDTGLGKDMVEVDDRGIFIVGLEENEELEGEEEEEEEEDGEAKGDNAGENKYCCC